MIEAVLLTVISALESALDGVFAALSQVLNDALNLVITPIPIPLLSGLWEVITSGSLPLSPLNPFSLMISVPATILLKATSDTSTQSTHAANAGDAIGDESMALATIFSGLGYAIFDGLGDLLDWPGFSVQAEANMALTIAGLGLGLYSNFSQSIEGGSFDPWAYLWLAASVLPLMVTYLTYQRLQEEPTAELSSGQKVFNGVYGVLMTGLAGLFIVPDSDTFKGPEYSTLMANIFVNVPYLGKAIFAEGPPSRIIASVIDAAGDVSSTLIEALVPIA